MENKEKYWDGKKNFVARLWYYELQGLDVVNQFKYLGAFILGIYALLKLTNPKIILIIFGISTIILLFIGYIKAWYFNKVIDWLTVELGTHWGRYTYELSERQNKLLEEIVQELKKRS